MAQILQDISWVGHQSGKVPFAINVQPINGKAINWSASKCFSGPCASAVSKSEHPAIYARTRPRIVAVHVSSTIWSVPCHGHQTGRVSDDDGPLTSVLMTRDAPRRGPIELPSGRLSVSSIKDDRRQTRRPEKNPDPAISPNDLLPDPTQKHLQRKRAQCKVGST